MSSVAPVAFLGLSVVGQALPPFRPWAFQLAGVLATLYFLLPFLLLTFVIIYVLGSARHEDQDDLVGAKVLVTFLLSVCGQLVLLGLAMFILDLLDQMQLFVEPAGRRGASAGATKQGLSLIVGGSASALFPGLFYLSRLMNRGTVRVERQALGVNAIITGIVFVTAVTMGVYMRFNGIDGVKRPFVFSMVYFVGHMICSLPLASWARSNRPVLRSPSKTGYGSGKAPPVPSDVPEALDQSDSADQSIDREIGRLKQRLAELERKKRDQQT